MAKSGEAEQLRRRLDGEKREYERQRTAIQQSHSAEMAKIKAELEQMRREREQAQTNSMFLEHDLAREADKTKRMRRPIREGVPARPKQNSVPSPSATPRRQRVAPLGDGFNDEDMNMASPTKNRQKSAAATPKQANKRKRPVADQSPIPALQLSEPRERSKAEDPPLQIDKLDPFFLEGLRKQDRRFELLHRLVNKRSSNGKDRVLEGLTRYVFPSWPEKKLSSLVYDELFACSLEQDVHGLARKICHIFLTVWDSCLDEKYYAPIYLCLDALHFILASEPCSIAVSLTTRAIPIILASVDLVSVPQARISISTNAKVVADLYTPAQRAINESIDIMDCLNLLYLIAASCVPSPDAIARFWQLIPFDFVLCVLQVSQPLDRITTMLRILSTSALPNSLGAILPISSPPDNKQELREAELINQLTMLLRETPLIITDPALKLLQSSEYPSEKILHLHLQILTLLTQFSLPSYGSTRLATNRLCLGRLFLFLDTCITSLYTSPLSQQQTSTRTLIISSINTCMKLIYHLKISNPDMDFKEKLNVVQGGHHKYLVTLTRLAFCEGLVLEDGIEEEVSDMAHAVLDEGLSPEEGDNLWRVFSSSGDGS